MSTEPNKIYRDYAINLTQLTDRPSVVWKVLPIKGRKRGEIIRDIAPDKEQARERAMAFIDRLLEQ